MKSFLLEQFMMREGEGGRPTVADPLGMSSHRDKEQRERRKTAGDQSTAWRTSQRAASKRPGRFCVNCLLPAGRTKSIRGF